MVLDPRDRARGRGEGAGGAAELGSCPQRERRQQGAGLQPAMRRASAANPEQVHPSALGRALNGCGEPRPAEQPGKKNKRKKEERSQSAALCCMESIEQPQSCLEPLLSHIGAAAPGTATAGLDPSSSLRSSRCSPPVPSTGLLEKLP